MVLKVSAWLDNPAPPSILTTVVPREASTQDAPALKSALSATQEKLHSNRSTRIRPLALLIVIIWMLAIDKAPKTQRPTPSDKPTVCTRVDKKTLRVISWQINQASNTCGTNHDINKRIVAKQLTVWDVRIHPPTTSTA